LHETQHTNYLAENYRTGSGVKNCVNITWTFDGQLSRAVHQAWTWGVKK